MWIYPAHCHFWKFRKTMTSCLLKLKYTPSFRFQNPWRRDRNWYSAIFVLLLSTIKSAPSPNSLPFWKYILLLHFVKHFKFTEREKKSWSGIFWWGSIQRSKHGQCGRSFHCVTPCEKSENPDSFLISSKSR